MISIFYEASVCFVLVFYLTENQKSWKSQNVLVTVTPVRLEIAILVIVQIAIARTADVEKRKSVKGLRFIQTTYLDKF